LGFGRSDAPDGAESESSKGSLLVHIPWGMLPLEGGLEKDTELYYSANIRLSAHVARY